MTNHPSADAQIQSVKMWRWAAENACFSGRYVTGLCDHWEDFQWLSEMQVRLERFTRTHVCPLAEFYTRFSMQNEYDSRIGVHKELLITLMENAK